MGPWILVLPNKTSISGGCRGRGYSRGPSRDHGYYKGELVLFVVFYIPPYSCLARARHMPYPMPTQHQRKPCAGGSRTRHARGTVVGASSSSRFTTLFVVVVMGVAVAVAVRITESSRLLVRRLPVYYEGISVIDNILCYVSYGGRYEL